MKKIFLSFLLFVFGLTANSVSKTFLGVTLGKIYTESEFRAAIKSNTSGQYEVSSWNERKLSSDSENTSFNVFTTHSVLGIPSYTFSLRTSNKELIAVNVVYDVSCGNLDLIYRNLADSLSALYPMEPIDFNSSSGLFCSNIDGMSIMLINDNLTVSVYYSENKYRANVDSSISSIFRSSISSLFPDIQDTFFGLKLGQKYSIDNVKNNVGTRGDFVKSRRIAIGTSVAFSKVSYAGKIWDYAEFRLNNEGQFAQFEIYDSFVDTYEERNAANELYVSYEELLDKKYSNDFSSIEKDEGSEMFKPYFGGNEITLNVFNMLLKSEGGSYRRYVGMRYEHDGILKRMTEENENEL